MLSEEDKRIKECQKYLLIMMKYVDDICQKEKIDYTLGFGTMLGACRHKGFIPWDDDADMVLTRENYDRLLKVLRTAELPEDIGVYWPNEHEKFYDFVVRLYYKKKVRDDTLCNEWYDGLYSYATLDFFVFDHVPDSRFLRSIFFFKLKYIYGLAMGKREKIFYEKHSAIEKLAIKGLTAIGKHTSIAKLYEKYDRISKSYYKKGRQYGCTTWTPEYFPWLYDEELYSRYIKTPFEDTEFMITDNYKKILAIDYGEDYMTPKKTHLHNDEFLNQ